MNTGSNPVGVAASDTHGSSENQRTEAPTQGATTEHPSSGLIRSGYDPGVSGTPAGVQEHQSGTVGEEVGEGAGEGVPQGDTGKTRKGRKPGLCKRRGCKEPVADILARLCAQHMPNGMGVAPEAPELPPGFTGCLPIVGQEVEVFYGTAAEKWKRLKVVVADGALFQVEGLSGPEGITYLLSEEGSTWRWPVQGDRRSSCGADLCLSGCAPQADLGVEDTEPHMVVGCPGCGKASASYDRESGLCYTCERERRERARTPPIPNDGQGQTHPSFALAASGVPTEEDHRRWSAIREARGLQMATGLDHVPPDPMPERVSRPTDEDLDEAAAAQYEGGVPEEAEQPNDGQPPAPEVLCQQFDCMQPPDPKGAGFCGKHAAELGLLPQIRVCAGVPGAVGDEVCHTILGDDVKGERCAHCEGIVDRAKRHLASLRANEAAMQAGGNPAPLPYRACDRVGCRAQREPGSRYCASHKRIAATVGGMVLREAFEAAWEALAESSQLDPATVAACKQLRDAEIVGGGS